MSGVWLLAAGMLLLLSAGARGQDPGLDVHVNRSEIYIGESLSVQVMVNGVQNPPAPDLSKILGCDIKLLGGHPINRHRLTIVNGRRREERFVGHKFSYKIKPQSPGPVRIGPITLTAQGRRLAAAGQDVNVLKIDEQDLVLIDIGVSGDSVLIDEPFDVTLRYRLKRLAGRYASKDPVFSGNPPLLTADFLQDRPIAGLGGPTPSISTWLNKHIVDHRQPGVRINDYHTANDPLGLGFNFRGFMNERENARFKLPAKEVTHEGVAYFEYALTLRYTPEEMGEYTFGPAILKGDFPVDVDPKGVARATPVYAVGAARTVRVVPPPIADRPQAYIGIVARNLTCGAKLDAQTCRVGDPLKLTLTIDTDGRLGNFTPPALGAQPEIASLFRVYDDTAQLTRQERRVLIEYTIRPTRAGTIELPPIELAYYDLDERAYRVVRTAPIPVRANETIQIALADVIAAATNTDTQVLSSGDATTLIRAPLNVDPRGAEHHPLVDRSLFWAVMATGPVFFCVCLVVRGAGSLVRRRREHVQRLSLAATIKRITTARDAGGSDARRDCLDAVRDYVASNHGVPREGLTPRDIGRLLSHGGVDAETSRAITALVETIFNAEFSAGDVSGQFQSECDDLVELLRKSEHRTRPAGDKVGVSVLVFILALPLVARGAEESFLWKQANAHVSSAQSAADFLAAARMYQRLVEAGIRNGPLFYNLGTALLNAERHAAAVVALRRAERYSGSRVETRRNLRLALAGMRVDGAAHLPWYRTPLFWHYWISAAHQGIIVAIGFALCWVAAGLRVWRVAHWKPLMGVSIAVVIVFGSSWFSIIQMEATQDRASPSWVARSVAASFEEPLDPPKDEPSP
jgi:hypothetical protein